MEACEDIRSAHFGCALWRRMIRRMTWAWSCLLNQGAGPFLGGLVMAPSACKSRDCRNSKLTKLREALAERDARIAYDILDGLNAADEVPDFD